MENFDQPSYGEHGNASHGPGNDGLTNYDEEHNTSSSSTGDWSLAIRDDHHQHHNQYAAEQSFDQQVMTSANSRPPHSSEDVVADLSVVGSYDCVTGMAVGSPQEFQHLQSELVNERSRTTALANVLRNINVCFTQCFRMIGSVLPEIAAAPHDTNNSLVLPMNGMFEHYANGTQSMSSPTRVRSSGASKSSGRGNRRPKKSAAAHASSEGGNADAHGGQMIAANGMPLLPEGYDYTTPRRSQMSPTGLESPRPKKPKQRVKIAFFGRAFLEFAVEHFENITTGWIPMRYPQGRPSMECAYASMISVLAFYKMYDMNRYEELLADASASCTNRSNVHIRYLLWSNVSNAPNNYDGSALQHNMYNIKGSDYEGGNPMHRPLRQNELRFENFADIYIECYGYMKSGEFTLYDTPRELPPELVMYLRSKASGSLNHAENVSYDIAPQEYHSSAVYDGYSQPDLDAYARTQQGTTLDVHSTFQSDHYADQYNGAPNRPVISVTGDTDTCIDLIRPQYASDTERSHENGNVAHRSAEPTANDGEGGEEVGVRRKKKRRRDQISTTTDHVETPLANEEHSSAQDVQEHTPSTPPPAKKQNLRAKILQPDGTFKIVALEPWQTVHNNKIVSIEQVQQMKQKRAAHGKEQKTPPAVSTDDQASFTAQHNDAQPVESKKQSAPSNKKKWLNGGGYKPTPK